MGWLKDGVSEMTENMTYRTQTTSY